MHWIIQGLLTSLLINLVYTLPITRDVELFGIKFKNPANMQTQLGTNTHSGSAKNTITSNTNPANFAATLTGTGALNSTNVGNINPANFAATLTGPGSQNIGTSSTGANTGNINPANFAATLTGTGTQSSSNKGTSTGQNPHKQVPGDMTAYLDQYNSQFGNQAGTVQHQLHEKPVLGGSGLSAINAQNQLPGTCVNSQPDKCPMACQSLDSVTGCIVCKSGCQSSVNIGNGAVQISSLSTAQTNRPTTVATVKQSGVCPAFPTNCPRGGVAIQNGCPVCTALQTQQPSSTKIMTTNAPITKAPTSQSVVTTTTSSPVTCSPVRCIAPCNKGIKFDANRCPICVC